MPHSHHSFDRSRTRTLLPPRYSMPLAPPLRCIPLSLSILLPGPYLLLTHTCMYTDQSPYIYLGRVKLFSPTHRSTYLTSYVSPFSDKGRLIFLCIYVCLPQPYHPPSSFVHASWPVSHTHVHRQQQAAISSLIDIAGVHSVCLASLSHHLLEETPLPTPPTL